MDCSYTASEPRLGTQAQGSLASGCLLYTSTHDVDFHSVLVPKLCWSNKIKPMFSPPFRLASTNTRIARTHSSKLSGVTWAASRTIKDKVSTHLMRDLVSCWPRSCPRVRLYWLTSGCSSWALELTGELLLVSRSSFPT